MSDKTVGDMAWDVGAEVGSAVWTGTKMAGYGQMLKRGRMLVETRLGDKYPEFMKTEAGRKTVEWLVASLVLVMALTMPENTPGAGPYKQQIIENAKLAVAKASENGAESMMELFFDDMIPLMMLFANADAATAPAIGAPARDFAKEAEALNKAKTPDVVEVKPVRSARPRRTEVG